MQLTLDFYSRNYIEGLFLSSGIIRDADYTMEQLVGVAKTLREEHDFRGYIHLKTIPDANADLLAQAGQYADRVSVNVELPMEESLARARAGKECADDSTVDGEPALAHRRIEGGQQGAEVCAGRSEHAGHRRRRRQLRSNDHRKERDAVQLVSIAARLLLRLQPDPGFLAKSCR